MPYSSVSEMVQALSDDGSFAEEFTKKIKEIEMSYRWVIEAGWKTGVHDCRGLTYQHPWLVVFRPTSAVLGCWTRKEARDVLRQMKKENS